MRKLLAILVATAFTVSSATAQPSTKSKNDEPPGFSKGERKGWKGDDVPPGWTNKKGEKKGWEGKDVPPGQR